MIELGPLRISWYGLLVGLGAWLGWELSVFQAKKRGLDVHNLEKVIWPTLIVGLVGARAWHVVTDWHLYQDRWLEVVAIWQGGISIFGALVGGVIGLWLGCWWLARYQHVHISWKLLADLSIFGLPVAQAVGRLGNWFNHELYGWPSNLPWAIFIPLEYRLPGLEDFERFQPLFGYESLVLLVVAIGVWWYWGQSTIHDRGWIGTGRLAALYAAGYAWLRFGLDFWRPAKSCVFDCVIGTNQVIMLVVAVGLSWWLAATHRTSQA